MILRILIVLVVVVIEGCYGVVNSSESLVSVQKRATIFTPVLFPVNAATGILVAIAIPLSLPNRNVFVSYNFEANYNMPNVPSDSFPGPIKRLPGLVESQNLVDPLADVPPEDARGLNGEILSDNSNDETTTEIEEDTTVTEEPSTIQKRDIQDYMLLSRKSTYRVLENRMDANGLNGKKCLLLAICESAQIPLLEHNGILGHILHIILT